MCRFGRQHRIEETGQDTGMTRKTLFHRLEMGVTMNPNEPVQHLTTILCAFGNFGVGLANAFKGFASALSPIVIDVAKTNGVGPDQVTEAMVCQWLLTRGGAPQNSRSAGCSAGSPSPYCQNHVRWR
jgi:hypothetical protein